MKSGYWEQADRLGFRPAPIAAAELAEAVCADACLFATTRPPVNINIRIPAKINLRMSTPWLLEGMVVSMCLNYSLPSRVVGSRGEFRVFADEARSASGAGAS